MPFTLHYSTCPVKGGSIETCIHTGSLFCFLLFFAVEGITAHMFVGNDFLYLCLAFLHKWSWMNLQVIFWDCGKVRLLAH
jgi:hypothetical protein